jgi:ribosomal-protein-alanine N-acetyltransferase
VNRVLREQRAGDGFAFVVVPVGSEEVVGQIRLLGWSHSERHAEIGYWLRRARWGQGLGVEAVRLVCGFGFRFMRLHRINATVVVGNDRSARVLVSAGFRREGFVRHGALLATGWRDEWLYGLLRGELRLERAAQAPGRGH